MWIHGRVRRVRPVIGVVALMLALAGPGGVRAQEDDQAGPPTGLDPCQLVTAAEASQLAGTTYTSGTESTNDLGGNMCAYGAQTPNVFLVVVAQATDAATAQAQFSAYEADAQAAMQQDLPAGVTLTMALTDVSDVVGTDRAAVAGGTAAIAGRTISASAMYMLKGATFVSFSDLQLGNSAPTADALEAQAQTVLGRLP